MSILDLSKYTKGEMIGYGSFGEVFKILDNETSKIYTAKISTIEYDSKDDFPKEIKREISIISKIRHPAILKSIGTSLTNFNHENKPVIITEYFPNGSLDKLLENVRQGKTKSEWNDTIKLIISYGIAAAMSFLHAHNIIHRDLKPSNILLTEYLCPILADFGLSKDCSLVSSSTSIKGTPLYLAPEIILGNECSEKSDVYAYSFILYEIYTNRIPFDNYTEFITGFKLYEKVLKGFRPDISSVPKPFKKLIKKCWSNDLSERPNFDEIVEQLENDKHFITDMVEENDFLEYVNYIKKSPQSIDKKVKIEPFSPKKTKIIKKIKLSKIMIYPEDQYAKLTKSCKNLIDEAREDTKKQYKVGSYLIKGKKLPKNVEIGIKYLQQAIKGGSIEAVIKYNRMLIIGKRIKENIKEAKNNLHKYDYLQNPEIIFLQAMIEKKERNYPKALNLLKKSTKAGIGEAMYEYGKMFYLGQGCDINIDKAMELFNKAKKNGCNKSDNFLEKQEIEEELKLSSYSKKIDLVFLIDGQISNKYFYEALSLSIKRIAKKCIDDNPGIGFRFGVVIYRNLIVSQKTIGSLAKWPLIYDLTKEIDDIKYFLDENQSYERGVKYANDWASGYHALVDQITWDEKAEKVVIQIADSPGYGGSYLMRNDLKSKFLTVPRFAKGNKHSENRKILDEILKKQDGWLYYNIIKLAKMGVEFYCLNGNEVALYCFNQVSKAFYKNDGYRFVIKDLFGFTFNYEDDDDDDEEEDEDLEIVKNLKKEILKFTLNVVNVAWMKMMNSKKIVNNNLQMILMNFLEKMLINLNQEKKQIQMMTMKVVMMMNKEL